MAIVIIDKYPLMRWGLIHFLGSRFRSLSIKEYESIKDFIENTSETAPELIILGSSAGSAEATPGLLTSLKKHTPASPVLIYDDQPEALYALTYLKAGATSYLSKSDTLHLLEEAVQETLGGKRFIADNLFEVILDQQINAGNAPVRKDPVLTPAEQEIADYLIRGIKTTSIAATLNKKPSTVSTLKNRIFKKLAVINVVELKEKLAGKRN